MNEEEEMEKTIGDLLQDAESAIIDIEGLSFTIYYDGTDMYPIQLL